MKKILAVLVALNFGPAWAQFKCTGPDGKVAFQQNPCAPGDRGTQMDVKVAAPPPPALTSAVAPAPSGNRLVKYTDQLARERKVREIEIQIQERQAAMAGRQAQLDADLATLRARKASANNNLAGATWEQSLSSEMQAITERHKAANDVELEGIKALRASLAEARAAARSSQ
jgi:hypothetical protein